VTFDWVTFALEIVNFLVLVWILQHFLYRPVRDTIARRKAAIAQTLSDAATKHAEAEALGRQYSERLADWDREKQALRAQAMAEVDAERARKITELQRALDQEREKRRVVEERQRDELRQDLEEEALAVGARFAARLLARVASPGVEAQLAAVAIEDIAKLPEARLQAIRTAWRESGSRMTVASAFPLPEERRGAIEQGLAGGSGKHPPAQFVEDPSLLAGLRISIGPWVLRANLRDELEFFGGAARHGA
jgi:F-type H+-transporting ATPase subunit b